MIDRCMASDATTRFSDRVCYYVKSRPSYPPALIDFMRDKLGLTRDHVVADVGSGTGIKGDTTRPAAIQNSAPVVAESNAT